MLEIEWTGQKNPSSQNTYVYTDALDVAGSLTKASSTITPPVSETTTTVAPTTTTTLAPTTTTTVAPTTTTTLAPTTTTTAPTQSTGKTYYVDPTNGNDANTGQSGTSAWKTLAKLQTVTFSAGDTILLKRGSTFQNQQLYFYSGAATGAAGAPVTVGAYAPEPSRSSLAAWTRVPPATGPAWGAIDGGEDWQFRCR